MKDNLFQMLLNLFEESLHHDLASLPSSLPQQSETSAPKPIVCKTAKDSSTRLLLLEESNKMTKRSYQLLYRMLNLKVINQQVLESLLHQVWESDSERVTFDEMKWLIRDSLSDALTPNETIYLDFVLSSEEKSLNVH